MIKAAIAFKKAVANIGFKKAVAEIKFGDFLIFRFFADALGLSDNQAKSVGKAVTDSQAITDLASMGTGKAVSDASTTSDDALIGIGKVTSDFGSLADQIDTLTIGKVLQDSSFASESQNMEFHKFITEAAGVTDDLDGEATANDDQEMTFTKVRSDLATIADLLVSGSGKGLSDTIGSLDSGSLRSQGYCAFDYFLEDYVGASRTF